ncbi:hypothetical protein PG997_006055 [Apiospora hydei]|uniref:Uncharacterized protein n=1 Tax=Apiospora hydei TaxID=1337664 RepID=A0ABR1WRG7_9PEZI
MSDLTPGSMANFSCTIGHWAEAAVPHGITVGEIAHDGVEGAGPVLREPRNVTKQPDDCVLWCELPRDRFPPNPKYDPPREGKYIDRFNECIKANMPDDGNGLATGVRYPNNANKTDGDSKPSLSSSSSSSGPSPTAGSPNAGETGKSAAVPVLRMPSVLSLGLLTVMAGVYTILS